MNIDVVITTAFIAAAVAGACLVVTVPFVGVAALRGTRRGLLNVTACAVAMFVLACVAFTILGGVAVHEIADAQATAFATSPASLICAI